ncbi:MAG: L-glyceraldehyde 3-phosphate reductase [Epulopiscium sp.]|nr:L-glyceraldehyde 3-phosphate reductase [Candidatus Epulonipiscium sp.]
MYYNPNRDRYNFMKYNRCGRSGLKLPAISLGLWHNFGGVDVFENSRAILRHAFNLGITHFDLANNYGPPAGSAEENFGKAMKLDFKPFRDELIISTKAGYHMWEGPYGEWGSRKYILSSLDQSLKRMNLDYVDIFYSHRPDPDTPIEETMGALDSAVRQGKALYVGISNYNLAQSKKAIKVLDELKTPCLIHQPSYSMFNRWIEDDGLLDLLEQEGVGSIVYSPLAQGLLTSRYLNEIPEDSRAKKSSSIFLKESDITKEKLLKIQSLNKIAKKRGQSLAQMSLAWVLRKGRVTSALIGASKISQLDDNVAAINKPEFNESEINEIEDILKGAI